jgi:hypothetical protein
LYISYSQFTEFLIIFVYFVFCEEISNFVYLLQITKITNNIEGIFPLV